MNEKRNNMTINDVLQNKEYLNTLEYQDAKTWGTVQELIRDKRVYIYGAGTLANIAFYRLSDSICIEGIVDSDEKKWGLPVSVLIPEAFAIGNSIIIDTPDRLDEVDPRNVAVLIASINYYAEISIELKNRGISHIYNLLFSELKSLNEGMSPYNTSTRKHEYRMDVLNHPISKNKIVFRSMGSFSDHGKYITNSLENYDGDFDIVWIVDNFNEELPPSIRKVWNGNWTQFIFEMETAHIWITDIPIQDYIIKRDGQVYINTKHWASVTLKRFYLDSVTLKHNNLERIKLWEYNSSIMDYIFSGSQFDEESCRKGFGFKGKFIRVGSPRSDAMFSEQKYIKRIKDFYNLPDNVGVLLYAPTYRYEDNSIGNYKHVVNPLSIEYEELRRTLSIKFKRDWYIILRLHPSLARLKREMPLPECVIDASDYPDSEELCSACDIMISDYSSIMFEPAFVKKPVFLYAPDRESYIDHEYDLLIDYDSLPFPIAETNEQLMENIMNFDQEKYVADVAAFLDRYGVHEDGHASDRAAEFILGLMKKV